jgi:hypothetical protein
MFLYLVLLFMMIFFELNFHCLSSSSSLFEMFQTIVVTYEIRVFFEGAQKEVFSSILKYAEQAELKLCPNM